MKRQDASARTLPEWGVGALLHACHRAFITEMQARLARHGVSFAQWMHLRHLHGADGISQVTLSRRLGIEKASSTAVLDELERQGLIARQRNPADRRQFLVSLTPLGRERLDVLIGEARQMNGIARTGVEDSDFAVFLSVLDALTINLRASEREPG